MNGIDNRVEDSAKPSLLCVFGGAIERVAIPMLGRNQHRSCSRFFRARKIALGEAEEIIGAGGSAAAQFFWVSRIDADRQSPRLQFSHCIFEMEEWRIRQAPEIDEVGALGAQQFRASDNRLDAYLRRIDNLSKDAQHMARQIESRSGLAKKHWQ